MIDWNRIIQDTPAAARYAYFDTGAAAPPPLPVVGAVKAYLDKTAEFGPYLPSLRKVVYEELERTRTKMAYFIHAESAEIAFTKNGTEAICLVARGIDWQPGDEVILPNTEMLSNVSVWHLLAKEKGIKVVPLKASAEGLIDPQEVARLISNKTRLISFVALSNVTGAVQPVQEICRIAKSRGVLSHVSASQALGLISIDISRWQCDFLSACGRKGLRAIEGSGVLYVRQPLIAALNPMLVGWWNSSVDGCSGDIVLSDTARRFEAGCPNVPAVISLNAALDYATAIGVEAIEARVRDLTQEALRKLAALPGFAAYGPQESQHRLGIIPFNIAGLSPDTLTEKLEAQHIIIEAGHFMATEILKHYNIERMGRISLHYFNSSEEIDRLVAAISQIIKESL